MMWHLCNRVADIRDENQALFCCGRFHSIGIQDLRSRRESDTYDTLDTIWKAIPEAWLRIDDDNYFKKQWFMNDII